jgi:transcriptional repressor NrdR
MRCPFCHHSANRVVDSRVAADAVAIRRRRVCGSCGRRFTTYERVEEVAPMVVKKDGRREPYDRAKIVTGLRKACEKRPISMETIEKLADRVERTLFEQGGREAASSFIGSAVMEALRETDQVAYVRFASVYRSFKDLDEFTREVEELTGQRKHTAAAHESAPADKKNGAAA